MVSGIEMTLFSDAYPLRDVFTHSTISVPISCRITSVKWVFTLFWVRWATWVSENKFSLKPEPENHRSEDSLTGGIMPYHYKILISFAQSVLLKTIILIGASTLFTQRVNRLLQDSSLHCFLRKSFLFHKSWLCFLLTTDSSTLFFNFFASKPGIVLKCWLRLCAPEAIFLSTGVLVLLQAILSSPLIWRLHTKTVFTDHCTSNFIYI